MKILLIGCLLGFSLVGRCDFASYFEIKYNNSKIYNSTSSNIDVIGMEADTVKEEDLIEVKYFECGLSEKNDYELHLKVQNTSVDLTFINDEPKFVLNMGWLTQFLNKPVSVYFHHTKYVGAKSETFVHKVIDILLA